MMPSTTRNPPLKIIPIILIVMAIIVVIMILIIICYQHLICCRFRPRSSRRRGRRHCNKHTIIQESQSSSLSPSNEQSSSNYGKSKFTKDNQSDIMDEKSSSQSEISKTESIDPMHMAMLNARIRSISLYLAKMRKK